MSGALERGFLDDVVTNIDDDLPRLAYADWLEENNRPERAEFIRVQVERARLPAWDAGQVRLRVREQELLKQHGEQWLAELPVIEGAKWEGFRRGIVAEVSFASYEAMRAKAHECRAVAPVEAVTVRWPGKRDRDKVTTPIAELRELTLTGRPPDEEQVAFLADSPQLSTLRILTVRHLWAEGLESLVASPHMARLKAFRLPHNQNLGNEGILALIGAASLTGLEELNLSGEGVAEHYVDDPVVSAPGMESLANWSGLSSVRSLNLAGNEFGRGGLRTLLRSKHAAGLKVLSLHACRLDGQAMGEFASALPGLKLEALNLGENELKELGVEYVATAPCLSELKALRMGSCEIKLEGARLLAKKARFLSGLRLLDVSHNHFGPAGLEALLGQNPPALHTLLMRANDLFDKGAEVLAGSPASDALLEVDLSHNRLNAAATRALGESPHLHGLLVLQLADNKIDAAALEALSASPVGRRLASLETQDTPPDPIPF